MGTVLTPLAKGKEVSIIVAYAPMAKYLKLGGV